MYEKEIKYLIFETLFKIEEKNTVFLNEFSVGCNARADIAAFNGNIHLLEIKSSKDSLQRLSSQVNYFLAYSEKCSLVIHSKHYPRVVKNLPKSVGLWVIEKDKIIVDRLPQKRSIEAIFLTEFWWASELKILLGKVLPGASKFPVTALRKALIELLPYETLCNWTKENLKLKFKNRSQKLVNSVLERKPFPKWEMPSINKTYLLKLRKKLLQDGAQKIASSLTWDCRSYCWIHQQSPLSPNIQHKLFHE